MATATATLKVRRKVAKSAHYTDSLKTLEAEFRRRGWRRPATGTLLIQLLVLVGLAVGGEALYLLTEGWLLPGLGLLLSAYGILGISTQAHTASHGAVCRDKGLNRMLAYLGYSVLLGLPLTYWRHKHITVHHKAPNIDGHDDDINLMPLFAMTEEQARRGGALARFYYRRVQWLVFLLFIPLITLNTMAFGWKYLVHKLVRKPSLAGWLDLGGLVLHGLIWIGVRLLVFPAGTVLWGYLLRAVLVGPGMFSIFAPAHFPHEAILAAASQRDAEFVLRQTTTTVNFRTGPIGRFLCAGVDFQIEHHLFAGYSHVYYPRMAPLIREFCERHGYPYRSLGWGEGILKSLVIFLRPKPLAQELVRPDA